MRRLRLSARVLAVEHTVMVSSRYDVAANEFVVSVRPHAWAAGRCGLCRRRCGRYDRGSVDRRWRSVDVGVVACYLQADVPRVRCPEHGVVTAWVPWARHGAGPHAGLRPEGDLARDPHVQDRGGALPAD